MLTKSSIDVESMFEKYDQTDKIQRSRTHGKNTIQSCKT